MIPEDVARLFSGSRAGFELVGYQEVGLPHWQLSLNCMVLSHKLIPALQEFVLRAVSADLRTIEDVSGFLGLDAKIITASMVPLFQEGFIRTSVEDASCFELTKAGQTLAERCEMITPEETNFALDFDGWRRCLVDLGNVVKYSSADLKKLGLWALPAFPADPPNADEIAVAEVRRLVAGTINKQSKDAKTRKEVLSVEGLHEKRRVFYTRAVALLFKSQQTGEIQVGFAIDGRLSPEHEESFTRAAGLKKLGVMDTLKQSVSDIVSLELDQEMLAAIDNRPEVMALARLAATRKRELLELERNAYAQEDTQAMTESNAKALEEAREKLATTEAQLTQYPVRMLEVFEHPEVLEEALRETVERLLIVSPWIKRAVVDDMFLDRLKEALERGVEVTICYGINRKNPAEGSDSSAINDLAELSRKHSNLTLSALGDTHAKVLVLDHRYVVVTSFNWLSFRGDPLKPFRDERGVLVSIPSKIDSEYAKYRQRALGEISSEQMQE